MGIIGIRAKKIFAGPGTWAWLAEALVKDEKCGERYVTVHYYDGEDYTVSGHSLYDYLADDGDEMVPDYLEVYDDYEDAKKSEYAEIFARLRSVIDMLE